jgi:flagellar transcriptional activator FlhC
MDNHMLSMTQCSCCKGKFVTEPYEISRNFVCGLCEPPARAGKGSAAGSLKLQ